METRNEPLSFSCRFCSSVYHIFKEYLNHQNHHRHVNQNYICGFKNCKTLFNTEKSLRSHTIRVHNIRVSQLEEKSTVCASNQEGRYVCTVLCCQKIFGLYPNLIKHLKEHIKNNVEIQCPLSGCQKRYGIVKSFTGHLSRNHRMIKNSEDNPASIENTELEPDLFRETDEVNNIDMDTDMHSLDNSESSPNDRDQLFKSLAQFYMKLEFQFLVPQSTVQYLVTEMKLLNEQNSRIAAKKLKNYMKSENVPQDNIDKLTYELFDDFLKMYDSFKTDHLRKKKYKELFPFVAPVKQKIKQGKFFYYVPIMDTIEAVLKDKSFDLKLEEPFKSENNVLKDFTDGAAFSTNSYFQENPEALRLILYQDAFELVTPIGPAKKKHKLIGIYLSIGNLPDYIRTHINSIQLVALCKENDFDHDIVYGKIVDDLKILENEGKQIDDRIVKGGLVFIAGDNLGSHSLGGFLENFSRAIYFCRFCEVDRPSFYAEGGFCERYKKRTVTSYNDALELQKNALGIKFNSKFNELEHFHVCKSGLPPCLGHDIFEGFGAYDVAKCNHYFVSQGWFTYEQLKNEMDRFPYSSEDLRDKPVPFPETAERVTGGAWQVWTFIRLFPLIIRNFIKDPNDPVWLNFLLLAEITEIICAPAIHTSFLPYLQVLIYEYLDQVIENFGVTTLRPKHHYLTHYPDLIWEYGPLTKVWTLRFESKHTFFKRCCRSGHNYKNIAFSLSNRHELFQSFLRSGADLRCSIKVFGLTDFRPHLYSEDFQQLVRNSNIPDNLQECVKTIVKGTTYRKGDVIVLRQKSYQHDVEMGRICFILFDSIDKIYFLVEKLCNEFIPHLRAYKLGAAIGHDSIMCDNLITSYPLHVYDLNGCRYVRLKHALVSNHIRGF